MDDTYYKILEVDRSATPEQIQKAYRRLAAKNHPDHNPDDKGAKDRFQKIQQAYDTLSDPEKRKLYDQLGPQYEQFAAGGHPGGFPGGGPGGFRWQTSGPGGADVDLNDIFSQILGGGGAGFDFGGMGGGGGPRATGRRRGRGRPAATGSDVAAEVTIPFQTAVVGGETHVALLQPDGSHTTIAVKIPPGIESGKKLRLAGQGEEGPGGPGDLIVTVRVSEHPWYQRIGNDLHVRTPVALAEAILGAKIDVPTPQGAVSVKIPPRTSSGKRLRLKGLGVKPRGGQPGDLYVEVQIVLPETIDDDLLACARRLEANQAANPRAELRW